MTDLTTDSSSPFYPLYSVLTLTVAVNRVRLAWVLHVSKLSFECLFSLLPNPAIITYFVRGKSREVVSHCEIPVG